MAIKKSDYGAFKSVSSFDMDQLAKLCSDEPLLVSDVLDTFCVEGRQRIESLDTAIERQNLPDAIFDAVSSCLICEYQFERLRNLGSCYHSILLSCNGLNQRFGMLGRCFCWEPLKILVRTA